MSSNGDPVSEFLAREQSALADLGDDFVDPPAANNGRAELTNGASEFDIGMNFDTSEANDVQPPVLNGLNGSLRGSPTFSHSRSQSQQPEEEPEKIRKWREQQKEMIAEKDKIEETKKEELRLQAKKELEQFYAQRNAQLEQRKKLNRERELALEENASPKHQLEAGAIWERVARMIEGGGGGAGGGSGAGGKGSKGPTSAMPAKDTTRMKQLIVSYARGEQPGEKSPSPDNGKKEPAEL